ncbi:4'-phosphopantetheinyl transferase family protein [Methylotetracoccus oryzae]|uniref:4'-phosphopantetheinyl transferase family protein n=1 Tax=Methylotetracoccus oryzae TaxID=1919059 RepID=UPI00111A6619|nr:4'-phosphopantetheinyl transferase superfamily protein [Methylotetracoccus oryzae]
MHDLSNNSAIEPPLRVDEHEVHVWEVDLDAPDAWPCCLDETERQRAQRFRFERDRRRWVAAHTALRRILSRYVGMGPDRLQFLTTEHGKPYLPAECAGRGIRFNLSHSGALALIAVARAEVGVDIEDTTRVIDWPALCPDMFSAREAQGLSDGHGKAALPPWAIWTLKEAYLKGRGCGLTLPLRAFEIMPDPNGHTFRIAIEAKRDDGLDWRLVSLDAPVGYAAGLAVTRCLARVRRFAWTGNSRLDDLSRGYA